MNVIKRIFAAVSVVILAVFFFISCVSIAAWFSLAMNEIFGVPIWLPFLLAMICGVGLGLSANKRR